MASVVVSALLDHLVYRCHPNGCPAGRTCCVGAAPEVSRSEVRAIDSILPDLVRLQPRLAAEDGFVDAFVPQGRAFVIELDDDGACPFLFRRGRRSLCAIHAWSLDAGRPVEAFKPRSCRHWPLVVERDERKRLRIAVHPSARALGCVAPRHELPGQPTLRQAFAKEIDELRGLLGEVA